MREPHSPILLIVAIVLFVISALINTGGGFRSVVPGQPSGPWGWGNWIFGWAMVFFAASFYPF